jgi:hypothetical protein
MLMLMSSAKDARSNERLGIIGYLEVGEQESRCLTEPSELSEFLA